MKIFGKTLSKKTKRELILRLLSIVFAGALLMFFAFYSFAWFSGQSKTNVTSMSVRVSTETYDILVTRPVQFESGYDEITGTADLLGLKSVLAGLGIDFTETNSVDATDLGFEMESEYSWYDTNSVERRYLLPGSYGKVTFYLRPKQGVANVVANFNLNLTGFVKQYDEDEDIDVMTLVDSSSVLNMLKGHILFFTERTGADHEHFVYSGFINESFSYNTASHSLCSDPGKTDCYKIVLYWEWPQDNVDLVNSAKYTDISTYLSAHPEYFYPSGVTPGSLVEAGDQYNDGDQLIGKGTDCLVLYIDAR